MKNLRLIGIELAEEGKYNEAIIMLKKAYDYGDFPALNDIGVIFEKNEEYEKAFECYIECTEKGIPVSFYNVGNLYEKGYGVKQDYKKAFEYYLESAKRKYCNAFDKISTFYNEGIYVEKNDKKAFKMALKGTKYETKYVFDPACNNSVGYYYQKGVGVKMNLKKSLKYYEKAAKLGSALGMYNTGLIYTYKPSSEKKINIGINYLIKAGKNKFYDAYGALANLYLEGKVVPKDIGLAEFWVNKGLENRSWGSLLTYTKMCLNGENLSKEIKLDVAEHAIALYIARSDEDYTYYLKQYNLLKEEYRNVIDWDDIELNAESYLNKDRKVC